MDVYLSLRNELSQHLMTSEKMPVPNLQGVKEAKDILQQMHAEVTSISFPQSIRARCQEEMYSFQSRIRNLERCVLKSNARNHNNNPFLPRAMEEGTMFEFSDRMSSSSARDALLGVVKERNSPNSLTSSTFDEHNARLEDSSRMANDAERMGHSILESLRKQREQLEHINFSVGPHGSIISSLAPQRCT